MPMMFGFASQRKKMLESELERFIQEMPQLGMSKMWLIGSMALGRAAVDSELELVVLQETDEPWRNRADFWTTHLRPRVGVQFNVFTPAEFEELADRDPLLRTALHQGEQVYG
jgi:predicted nucleotidyltransferase